MDSLTISPTNEKREDKEVVLPSLDLTPVDPPWWKEDDKDWNIEEMLRIDREIGTTGICLGANLATPCGASSFRRPLTTGAAVEATWSHLVAPCMVLDPGVLIVVFASEV